jgi:hypothetical protein
MRLRIKFHGLLNFSLPVRADFDAADGFDQFGDGHARTRVMAEGGMENEEIFRRKAPACAKKSTE